MNAVTVSQVNTYIRSMLDGDKILSNIYVLGEISNYRYYSKSGHIYLTLKDDKSQLRAVMFSSYASRLKFALEDGMKVICRGKVSTYEKDGQCQLYIQDIQPDGVGALNLAYEQLKKRLAEEGLFDQSVKKQLPQYPQKIGVVTSNVGAAVQDIKNITARRYPICELVICPTVVQGESAAADIVNSIGILDSMDDIDLIIIARGGGSAEDLWCFNDERVARAVYACTKPVISAVGHETDNTICDYVADFRAPTPSAAAELAVPDMLLLRQFLLSAERAMQNSLKRRLENEIIRFDKIINSVLFNPDEYFSNKAAVIDNFSQKLTDLYTQIINSKMITLSACAERINDLSPLNVLSRGFSTISGSDGSLIRTVKALSVGDKAEITLFDGKASCTIDEVIYGKYDI